MSDLQTGSKFTESVFLLANVSAKLSPASKKK